MNSTTKGIFFWVGFSGVVISCLFRRLDVADISLFCGFVFHLSSPSLQPFQCLLPAPQTPLTIALTRLSNWCDQPCLWRCGHGRTRLGFGPSSLRGARGPHPGQSGCPFVPQACTDTLAWGPLATGGVGLVAPGVTRVHVATSVVSQLQACAVSWPPLRPLPIGHW